MSKPWLIIPAYEPDQNLVSLVDQLQATLNLEMVVINDGSSPASQTVFDSLKARAGVTVLEHAVNLGKGAALKTGFNEVLVRAPEACGVVSLDADGQHVPADVAKLVKALEGNPNALSLGVRQFDARGKVPLRSRFGNQMTRLVFRFFTGAALGDTQTGLRGIPAAFMKKLLKVRSDGYEFETDMLVQAVQSGISLVEVPIQTVYLNGNRSSHFDVLRDSARIYFVFVRFAFSSVATAAIDFVVFSLAQFFGAKLLLSSFCGRLVAGTFNFMVGKKWVFKSRGTVAREAFKYFTLVVGLMLVSNAMIRALQGGLGWNVYVSKIAAETLLFALSFSAQRLFVFGGAAVSKETDWDAYYQKPFKTASVTRKITQARIIACMKRHADLSKDLWVTELGGGNSCFFGAINQELRPANYLIVDKNRSGLDRFKKTYPDASHVQLIEGDIMRLGSQPLADICFSVGVIEHFSPEGTQKAIKAHFDMLRPGGIALITFPTPTFLYSLTRGLAELFGLWEFPDEVPQPVRSVVDEIAKHGEIQHVSIIWPIFLTQGVVVARSREAKA